MGKKERMERDPSIDPKTGKKRERRLKDEDDPYNPDLSGGKARITVEGVDLKRDLGEQIRHMSPEQIKRAEEKMREAAEKASAKFFSHDPISIEGRADTGGGRRSGGIMSGDMIGSIFANYQSIFGDSLDTDEMRKIAGLPPLKEQGMILVQRSLWQTAMEVWDYPSGVRVTVWRQEDQASTLITVEYMDPEQEVDDALVKGTVEFTDEALSSARGGPELMVQNKLEQLKENCDADMAAFEEDGDEGA